MAEIAVSLVADILAPFLVEEAKTLKGVSRSEIRSINDEMEIIRFFLRDADAKAETDEQVKIWVRQLRQVAFRMEDVIDEFRLRLAQQPPNHSRCLGWIHKTFASVKHLNSRRVINKEMQDIKANLLQINQQREKYQFSRIDPDSGSSSSNSTSWQYLRDDALYVEESELVGNEKHKNELISWLVEGDIKRTVFAVVGAGGIGKTTLVRKAYQSPLVLKHFECRAWVTVSQSAQIEQLPVTLIKQFQESRNETFSLGTTDLLDRSQLTEKLREYLDAKRYVVILDDVWKVEVWNFLKHALLDNCRGSRIMVTTRDKEVADAFVESPHHIFYHKALTLKDALVLFNRKAFGSNCEEDCHPELKEFSEKIVKKCGGLPLAIVAIGGVLLMKENTVLEWKKFHDSLSFKLEEDARLKNIMKVISLSYHDLPYHLKSCFLYFGLFPEDCVVKSSQLTTLWIGEGFVKEQRGKTLEEVADDYLDQLISRNLVHVDDESLSLDHFKLCKVHDLMHEFILSRCANEDFCELLDERSIVGSSNSGSRRISIQNIDTEEVVENLSLSSHVRSLVVFKFDKLSISFIHKLLSSFGLLKILDLDGAPLEEFPREITKLYHLRYLNLSDTRIKTIPDSVRKLQNLETLSLENTDLVELPLAILTLKKLRHMGAYRGIYAEGVVIPVKIPEEIGCLTALQSLTYVDVNQGTNLIKNLGKLTELRFLGVANLRRESGVELCASIAKMNHLTYLVVRSFEDDVIDLQLRSSPPSFINTLDLTGRLENLPNWISLLSNLLKIYLSCSKLKDDPLKVLQGLPNLVRIYLLKHAYDGEELCFKAGSFQKLKLLALSESDNLHSLIIEEGAMPNLKRLYVNDCKQLKEVPIGITHLTKLKTLTFRDMSEGFFSRLDEDGGEDYWKVKHVPLLNLL